MEPSSTETPAVAIGPETRRALGPFLSEEEGEVLAGYLEYREFPAEAVVIQDGESPGFFAFLAQGKLAVKKETSFLGKHILVALLDPGSLVGDYALAGMAPLKTGTVAALEPSRLLILTHDQLNQVLDEHPVLGGKILSRLVQVLALRLGKSYDRLAWLL
jgi:CRP-like cAMP-binding protein